MTMPDGAIINYTYDPTYQLISADHTNIPDETYTYDPVGNRLTATVDNANRLTEDANYTYTYDNNGNLIQKTHKITQAAITYAYDFENRLIKINLPLGITAEYKYDPFGRRIEKNISGQITTKYLYDREDIIMEYAAIIPTNTNITTKYIHGPGIDEPLSMIRNNKTYYYHADALGSITRMTDQNGNTVQTIKYDTFGNIKSISNPLIIQPYAWTGREFDIESGFYYLRNRYYDPRTGRFISKDPIGFGGGDVNLFRYVGNGPVNWVDPFGLGPKDKLFGLPKKFWNWYHRQRKEKGDPDITKEQADEYYQEWKDLGKPRPDDKGKFRIFSFYDLLFEIQQEACRQGLLSGDIACLPENQQCPSSI